MPKVATMENPKFDIESIIKNGFNSIINMAKNNNEENTVVNKISDAINRINVQNPIINVTPKITTTENQKYNIIPNSKESISSPITETTSNFDNRRQNTNLNFNVNIYGANMKMMKI